MVQHNFLRLLITRMTTPTSFSYVLLTRVNVNIHILLLLIRINGRLYRKFKALIPSWYTLGT